LTHAAFGSESAGGDGSPVLEVCHKIPSGSIPLLAVHPGKAGGITLSKLSLKIVINWSLQGGGLGSVGARTSIPPELLFSAASAGATAVKAEADPPAVPAITFEEWVTPKTAMPAVRPKSKQEILRNRARVITEDNVLIKRAENCQVFPPLKMDRGRATALSNGCSRLTVRLAVAVARAFVRQLPVASPPTAAKSARIRCDLGIGRSIRLSPVCARLLICTSFTYERSSITN
jgi:hypothetical protein